jgi:hypothetical protein
MRRKRFGCGQLKVFTRKATRNDVHRLRGLMRLSPSGAFYISRSQIAPKTKSLANELSPCTNLQILEIAGRALSNPDTNPFSGSRYRLLLQRSARTVGEAQGSARGGRTHDPATWQAAVFGAPILCVGALIDSSGSPPAGAASFNSHSITIPFTQPDGSVLQLSSLMLTPKKGGGDASHSALRRMSEKLSGRSRVWLPPRKACRRLFFILRVT